MESETFENMIQILKQKCHIRQYDSAKIHKQWGGSWPSCKWKECMSNTLQSPGGQASLKATGDGYSAEARSCAADASGLSTITSDFFWLHPISKFKYAPPQFNSFDDKAIHV